MFVGEGIEEDNEREGGLWRGEGDLGRGGLL